MVIISKIRKLYNPQEIFYIKTHNKILKVSFIKLYNLFEFYFNKYRTDESLMISHNDLYFILKIYKQANLGELLNINYLKKFNIELT